LICAASFFFSYVHRLIQNRTDGKLVELPSLTASTAGYYGTAVGDGGGPNAAASLNQQKIEAIGAEYTHLLTSQLDSQRAYYEERVGVVREQLALAESRLMSLEGSTVPREQLAVAESRLAELELREKEKAHAQKVLERDNARLEQKAEKAIGLARTLERELAIEREVSKGLYDNIKSMKEENATRSKETAEMKLQVRFLLLFLPFSPSH
jgi:BRCA1-associated protein